MKLINLKAKNLFSLGEVSLSLSQRGLTLVTGYSQDEGGANGAGKSSLANKAIIWTLYGQTAGGLKADNVLNRHGKKKGRGEVKFIGVDGATYNVVRERPAKLTLIKRSKDVSSKKATDTQKAIDAALGMNFATFIQTAFFGQGRAMSYASLTPKEQKALLEEILPMEDVDRWAKYADAELKKLKLDLINAEKEAVRVEAEQNALQSQLKQAEVNSESWSAVQEEQIKDLEQQIAGSKINHDGALQRIQATREQYAGLTVGGLFSDIEALSLLHDGLTADKEESWKNEHTAQESYKQWSARFVSLNKERDELATATSCSQCLRPYDDDTVQAVKDRMTNNASLLTEAEANVQQGSEAAIFYGNEAHDIRKHQADLERDIADLRHSADQIASIDDSEKRIVEVFEHKQEMFQADLAKLKTAMNPHGGYIETATEKLDAVSNEWLGAQTHLGVVNSELEHLTYWRDVYAKELKLKLFETCCAFLDSRTAAHLKGLRNEQLHVEFSTIKRLSSGASKDEFSVHVWSETGGIGFDSLSGGEQQMASFAIGLALADLAAGRIAGSSEFLILDEPFLYLDPRNCEAIVEYLTGEFGQGKDTLLLISNEEALQGLIPNRVHVVKHHGITEIDNVES